MNILIMHPDTRMSCGGVANYFRQLQGKFSTPVRDFVIGKRPKEKGFLSRVSRLFGDYWRFEKCLRTSDADLVHVNPSLDFSSLMRDAVFVLLAKIHKKKVVVFFHGWQKSTEARIERNFSWMFRAVFGRSDAFVVLCDQFGKTLKRWGVVQPIYEEVTIVSEDDLAGFDIQSALKKRQGTRKWRILFLSRVIKNKGIYETVEAVSLLQARYPVTELVVAGDGSELENIKSFVRRRNMSNVTFVGFVRGQEKRQMLENAQVLCLPTYHGEGLPCSVVEAMAFGLPVVTRPVGGLKDFFKNEEHGFISDSLDPNVFASLIERLLTDEDSYDKISLNNYRYAQSHFLASDAASRLEAIYETVLKDRETKEIG